MFKVLSDRIEYNFIVSGVSLSNPTHFWESVYVNERERARKDVDLGNGEVGRIWEESRERSHNQNLLYEKASIFNEK